MNKWNFILTKKSGSIYGDDVKQRLDDSKYHGADLLAREAIQNSVDAQNDPSTKIKIVVREVILTGSHKKNFLNHLDLDAFHDRRAFIPELRSDCILDHQDDNEELRLIFIEDFHTHGLYGTFKQDEFTLSSIFKLFLQPGDGDKAENAQNSGGSYGFGKAAFSSNSQFSTIFAYTNFNHNYIHEDIKERENYKYEEGTISALMGCGYHKNHQLNGMAYTGVCVFPKLDEDGDPIPVYNEEADLIAKDLLFTHRSEEDTGTSMLLIDTEITVDELKKSIEDFWWPKIIDQEIEFELIKEVDGERSNLEPPRPRLRESLRPFITAYEILDKKGVQKNSYMRDQQDFNKGNLIIEKPGSTAIQEVNPELVKLFLQDEGDAIVEDYDENQDLNKSKLNKVAIMRNPKMIIDYFDVNPKSNDVFAVGVYRCNKNDTRVDHILKMSEPPSHQKWDKEAKRLKNKLFIEGVKINAGSDFVFSTEQHFKRYLNETLNNLRKSKEDPEKKSDFNELSKYLGKFFKPVDTFGSNTPDNKGRPITISNNPNSRHERKGDKLRYIAHIEVAVSKNFFKDKLELEFAPRFVILGHKDSKTEDIVPIEQINLLDRSLGVSFDLFRDKKSELRASMEIVKGAEYKAYLEVISEYYDSLWTVQFNPQFITGEV